MILADLFYLPETRRAAQRNYVAGFVVGWFTHSIVQFGRHTILQEVPFGGYRVHIIWKAWFWDWNSHNTHFENAIEDLYATAPASSTPISMGHLDITYKYALDPINANVVVLHLSPEDGHWTFVRFPQQDQPFWIYDPAPPPPTIQYTVP